MQIIAHSIETLNDAKKAVDYKCNLLEFDVSQNIFSGKFVIQHSGLKGKLGIGQNLDELLNSQYVNRLVFDLKHAKYSLNYSNKFNKFLTKKKIKDLKLTGIDLKIISEIAKQNHAEVFYGFLNSKSINTFWQQSSILYKPAGFSIKSNLINEKLIDKLKSKYPKAQIWAWTVDSKDEVEKLKKLKIDGIVTNNWRK